MLKSRLTTNQGLAVKTAPNELLMNLARVTQITDGKARR